MCDSLIGTLINIQGNTKYGKIVCLNLGEMVIRQELAPKEIEILVFIYQMLYAISQH